jgi:hypothetical protein
MTTCGNFFTNSEQTELIRKALESLRLQRPEDAVQEALTLWVERERRRAKRS